MLRDGLFMVFKKNDPPAVLMVCKRVLFSLKRIIRVVLFNEALFYTSFEPQR